MNTSASLVFKNIDTISSARGLSGCDKCPGSLYFLLKEII
jgi:hypothetical protein